MSVRHVLFWFCVICLGTLIALPILAIALYAVFPDFNSLSFHSPFASFKSSFNDPELVTATLNSLKLAIAVTIASPMGRTEVELNRAGLFQTDMRWRLALMA